MEILQELLELVVPIVKGAIVLLGAFALWALKNYLDSLKRRATLLTDEDLASQVVGAVAQVHPTFSGEGKKETAMEKLGDLGVNAVDADRLIEAEVEHREWVRNGG